MMEITLVNFCTSGEHQLTDAAIQDIVRALNRQLSEDLAPHYSLNAHITYRGGLREPPNKESPRTHELRGHGIIYIIESGGNSFSWALGWHSRCNTGIPYSFIYADLIRDGSNPLSMVLSHELLEMVVNPDVNRMAQGPAPEGATGDEDGAVFYSYEICDPVNANRYAIDGVVVSDFVLPAWFTPHEEDNARTSFMGAVAGGAPSENESGVWINTRPLKSFEAARGGYASYYDPGTSEWENVYGDDLGAQSYSAAKKNENRRQASGIKKKRDAIRSIKGKV